jgi:hypothetical protein
MQNQNRTVSALIVRLLYCTGCLLLSIALSGAGCSGRHAAARQAALSRVVTPLPPPFLTGPAALLLTNVPGFSAAAEVQAESSMSAQRTVSGQLLGRGSKLLFAPSTDELADAQHQPGGYSFIWDVAQSRGYVLSEALQGYAPVASALHVTNIETVLGKAAAQRLAGHPCESATVTAQTAEGTAASFQVLRAMDLNGFPARIESAADARSMVLTFSKIRLEAPSADIFSPPEGFTKYPSPEAMADELAARQHNLRRRSSGQIDPLMNLDQRRY